MQRSSKNLKCWGGGRVVVNSSVRTAASGELYDIPHEDTHKNPRKVLANRI